MHSVAYAHQLDTLYRVGIKKYDFITQLDTMYRVCVHNVSLGPQLGTLYRFGYKWILLNSNSIQCIEFVCIMCLFTRI